MYFNARQRPASSCVCDGLAAGCRRRADVVRGVSAAVQGVITGGVAGSVNAKGKRARCQSRASKFRPKRLESSAERKGEGSGVAAALLLRPAAAAAGCFHGSRRAERKLASSEARHDRPYLVLLLLFAADTLRRTHALPPSLAACGEERPASASTRALQVDCCSAVLPSSFAAAADDVCACVPAILQRTHSSSAESCSSGEPSTARCRSPTRVSESTPVRLCASAADGL